MLAHLTVQESHQVLMVQFSQLLEYFDFLAQEVLRLGQVLLGDRLDGHHFVGRLQISKVIQSVIFRCLCCGEFVSWKM